VRNAITDVPAKNVSKDACVCTALNDVSVRNETSVYRKCKDLRIAYEDESVKTAP
jgi:hypothetical protein